MDASRGTDSPSNQSLYDTTVAEPSPTSEVFKRQPRPVAPMEIAAVPSDSPTVGGTQEWKHGLFQCLGDVGLTLVSCFMPCTVYARNNSRYQHLLMNDGVPHPELGDTCNKDCLMSAVCCIGWYLESRTRTRIRERYSIEGSRLGDTLAACCCAPCALTQESRQLREEEMAYLRNGPVGPRYSKWMA